MFRSVIALSIWCSLLIVYVKHVERKVQEMPNPIGVELLIALGVQRALNVSEEVE